MKLNFEKAPVSREAIDKALAERREKQEATQALAYAQDEDACQKIVDSGRRYLKALRKAADDFHTEFEKLKGLDSTQKFAEVLAGNPVLRSNLGVVRLIAEYEES